MEDAAGNSSGAALSLDDNDRRAGRMRSGSASSGHKRSTSGSLLSRLSFLRMIQATQNTAERSHSGLERDDGDELTSGLRGGRAMSNAIQQHRRTRRRRGSLRKTALLGTRLDYRDKKTARVPADVLRGDSSGSGEPRPGPTPLPSSPSSSSSTNPRMRYLAEPVSRADDENTPLRNLGSQPGDETDTAWMLMDAPQRARAAAPAAAATTTTTHRQSSPAKNSLLGIGDEMMTTDDEEIISFPRASSTSTALHSSSTTGGATGLRLPSASSASDSYYTLQTDPTYRALHRAKSPLATHAVDMAASSQMVWDYSETEWWGWIILIVTWLVFVVGMGSCFGVWSWAWDVGETPYAPPELEDDPTLPIVGYYPALIILTAVMSWVWVVVAWVGMKYFKHANISGEDI